MTDSNIDLIPLGEGYRLAIPCNGTHIYHFLPFTDGWNATTSKRLADILNTAIACTVADWSEVVSDLEYEINELEDDN